MGSLLKDFDYFNEGHIEPQNLKKILECGVSGMTPADIDYFVEALAKSGGGKIEIKHLVEMINLNLAEG
jgi:Ca2+-binding EF-hand superfamily protein